MAVLIMYFNFTHLSDHISQATLLNLPLPYGAQPALSQLLTLLQQLLHCSSYVSAESCVHAFVFCPLLSQVKNRPDHRLTQTH